MQLKFFSRSDPFVVAFFRVTKWILRFLCLWPLDPFTRAATIKVTMNMGILLTAIIGEIRFTWLIRINTTEALGAICPCLTKVVTWIKLLCFVIYRKELAKLLREIKEHLRTDTEDFLKKAMIERVSFLTNVWSMWLFFFGISTNGFYTTKPLIVWAYKRFNGENDTWVGLPFQAALPYADMTELQDKTLYTGIYLFLAYSGNVTIFGFPAVDGTFMCLCMYISVSHRCLQEDFIKAFQQHSNTLDKEERNAVLYIRLSRLVKRHHNVFVMTKRSNRVYKIIIFGHFLFAGIVLGVVLVDLLLTSGISRIINVLYTMGAFSQLYTYCYGGENLHESSSKLSETLYFCNWYDCDTRVKKLMLFVMMKSQKGSSLSAPFFTPSLPLFKAITKTSGSYITLLREIL